MCRWMVFIANHEVLIADVVTKPHHSIISMSHEHYLPDISKNWSLSKLENLRRVNHELNGDGFGMGWYVLETSPEPCVFVSTTPPWNNRNLLRLSDKIKTNCLFTHVRAASPGSFVSEANCHPFQFGRFLFMHNGGVPGFHKVKLALLRQLSDKTMSMIAGTTDTEHIGALFIEYLGKDNPHSSSVTIEEMKVAMLKTIRFIVSLTKKFKTKSGEEIDSELSSSLNLAVTDGKRVVATRYRNHPTDVPPSLYYNLSSSLKLKEESKSLDLQPIRLSAENKPHEDDTSRICIISSEPLTYHAQEWALIPPNHMIWTDDESFEIKMTPIHIGTIVERCFRKWKAYKKPSIVIHHATPILA